MKCLIVYQAENDWFGQEVKWHRSGSGFYREVTGVGIPQSKDAIAKFATENDYTVEWRGDMTATPPPRPVRVG